LRLSETWAALTSRDTTDPGRATAELWPADYDWLRARRDVFCGWIYCVDRVSL